MCIRSDRYDQEITLLHFENTGSKFQGEDQDEDPYERIIRRGQP